jgi:hypothetical protein
MKKWGKFNKKCLRWRISCLFKKLDLIVYAENKYKKSHNKFIPRVSMFRLLICLCHGNKFWYSMWHHSACSGHWHNYILLPRQAIQATVQSIFLGCPRCQLIITPNVRQGKLVQGVLKGEVSQYRWSPIWLVWNKLYDNWQFWFLFAKQTNPNQSNRRSMVQSYLPLLYSLAII